MVVLAIFCGVITSKSEAAKLIANNAKDQSISVVILNSNGDPNSNVDVTTLDVYIQLDGAHPQSDGTTLTEHTNDYDGHQDWYAKHMGNGLVRIDIPDANLADGAGSLLTYIVRSTASDANSYYEVQLTPPVDVNLWDESTNGITNWTTVFSTDWATNYDTTTDMWNVDVTKWLGTDCATPTTAGVPEVDITYAGGNAVPCLTAQLVSDGATASDVVDEWENQSSTDPTGFQVNVMEVAGTAQAANDMSGDIDDILEDTGTTLPAAIAAISTDGAAWHSTTVVSASSTSAFIITSGVSDDDDYNGFLVTVTDADGDNVPEPAFVDDYNGDTLTVTLSTPLSFTPASGDQVQFLAGFGGDYGITLFRK
jgi:hypothetical protein